jgi:aminoglycoside phosphotransferase (APT) family kinase protein
VPSSDPLAGLPHDQREAVGRILAGLFGTSDTKVAPIKGGASPASLFRVDVGPRRCLLRVEGPHSPLRVPTQYEAMRMAVDAGLAPRLHHADPDAGIVVMDFIEQWPLSAYPGGIPALTAAMGAMIARLQASPAIPAFVDYPDMVSRLFAHVRRTGLFAAGVLDPHWERLQQIREAWDRDPARLVSSHNDCHPGNFLFDGERLWLVDWESAYRNDRFVDIAILLDNVAPAPDLREVLIRAWIGRHLDADEQRQLDTARALTRLYFAGFFLSGSAAAQWLVRPDTDLSVTMASESGPARMHMMGKLYLQGFLTGSAVPRLVPVSDGH